jgi:hypothetical protein
MRYAIQAVVAAAAVLFPAVWGAAPTDEYRDADQLQSGYLPNHNMNPDVVNSVNFGQLWRVFTGGVASAAEGGGNEQYVPSYSEKMNAHTISSDSWPSPLFTPLSRAPMAVTKSLLPVRRRIGSMF